MGKTQILGSLVNTILTDSSNNVGIGGAANASFKLQVTGTTNLTGALTGGAVATFTAAANPLILKSTAATTMYTEYYYNTSTLSGYIGNGSGILTGANNSDFIVRSEADLVLATGNNRRMTIASSTGAATFSSAVNAQLLTIQNGYYLVGRNAANTSYRTLVTFDSSNKILIGQDSDITAITLGANSETMRITSSGNVLIGRTTSGLNNTEGVTISSGSIQPEGNSYVFYGNRTTSDGLFMGIRRNNVDVGSITVTTSATAFNTSSDYRLKQDLKEFNGLSIINSIKTYDYEWKIDSTRAYGVIAHELEEILPYAVFGKKDEINENGNIKPQAVDYSKLVPILIKSIQELEARIKQLENK